MNKERFRLSNEIYFGFTPEFIILKILAKSKKNSVAIDEIVKQASLSKKKIYNELKKLEDKVFIKIISNRNDRRKNKIVITSQGKEIVKKLTKEFFRI